MGKSARRLEWHEYMALMAQMREDGEWRLLLMAVIAGHTAFRASDWTRLRWIDLLNTPEVISIVQKKTEAKNKKPRVAWLSDYVLKTIDEVVHALRQRQDINVLDYCFVAERGGTTDDYGRRKPLTTAGAILVLKTYAEKYGFKNVTTHTFRKTFAWRVYQQNGANEHALILVNQMLGHFDLKTTRRYLGFDHVEIVQAYKNLT